MVARVGNHALGAHKGRPYLWSADQGVTGSRSPFPLGWGKVRMGVTFFRGNDGVGRAWVPVFTGMTKEVARE